jgi:hypothetical protein
LFALIHANSDGDFHACPSTRPASLVVTAKSAHDTSVVGLDTANIIVEIMKSKMKAIGVEQAGHIIVH